MVWTMAAKRFTVTLERAGETATTFRVPFDLEGAKRPGTSARRIIDTVDKVKEGEVAR